MKNAILFSLPMVALLSGCETLQTPQQRQQATARQTAAMRVVDERVHRVEGRLESVEMENARLAQEVQRLQAQVRSYDTRMAQLDSSMQALAAKQARESKEVVRRVEGLLKKSVASRPAPSSGGAAHRGPGHMHTVEAGHTLSAIAAAYGTTVEAIKKANHLKSDNIYVGQKLFIPE